MKQLNESGVDVVVVVIFFLEVLDGDGGGSFSRRAWSSSGVNSRPVTQPDYTPLWPFEP